MASSEPDVEIIEMEGQSEQKEVQVEEEQKEKKVEKAAQAKPRPFPGRKEKIKSWGQESSEAGLVGYTPAEAAIAALKMPSFQDLPEPDKVNIVYVGLQDMGDQINWAFQTDWWWAIIPVHVRFISTEN